MNENTTEVSSDVNAKPADSSQISENLAIQNTVNTETFDNLKKEVLQLKDDFNNEKNKIVSLKTDFEKSKFDLITLIGIFVGLITYLGLEIQVFKTINNPLLIIGVSVFFIASILLFILGINSVMKKMESLTWRDFNNPLYVILTVLLIISIFFILIGYKDYSNSNLNIHYISNYEN
ncbi:MAG: hypothetical protein QG568_409 [Patescibacteria group bacterium]|nr:hypothetical protein [Patescibacteria group bacterium]